MPRTFGCGLGLCFVLCLTLKDLQIFQRVVCLLSPLDNSANNSFPINPHSILFFQTADGSGFPNNEENIFDT